MKIKKVNYRATDIMGFSTQPGDTYKTLRLWSDGSRAILLHMPREKGECPSLEIAIISGRYYESLDNFNGYINISHKEAKQIMEMFS